MIISFLFDYKMQIVVMLFSNKGLADVWYKIMCFEMKVNFYSIKEATPLEIKLNSFFKLLFPTFWFFTF